MRVLFADHKSGGEESRRPRRVLIGAITTVVVILVILRALAGMEATRIINAALPKALDTQAKVENVSFSLLAGSLSLLGVDVKQPDGFEGPSLLTISRAYVDIGWLDLLFGGICVENAILEDVDLCIISDSNGVVNAACLGKELEGTAADHCDEEREPVSTGKRGMPVVVLRSCHVKNARIDYRDLSAGDEPFNVRIADLNLKLSDVVFDESKADEKSMPGAIELTATVQQGGADNARVGAAAKIGALGKAAYAANAVLRICGLDLDGLKPMVPLGTARSLGGRVVDLSADLSVAPDLLNCDGKLKTADGSFPIEVRGTPKEPNIDRSSVLFGVFGRLGGGPVNVAGDVAMAGVKAAGGVGKTVFSAGKGVCKTAGSLGSGVIETAKGIVTADLDEAVDGVKKATVGTLEEAAATIVDTSETAAKETVSVAKEAVGVTDAEAWQADAANRWSAQWKEAIPTLEQIPFPGAKPER